MTQPSHEDLAEWRAHAAIWANTGLVHGVLAQRLLAVLDMLEPAPPITQCSNRPKVSGQLLGCEPNRLARGRCIWCHQPPPAAKVRR